jgi:hypothetical protein
MKKSEILSMDNEQLVAHLLKMETRMTKETNDRGITKATAKEYDWTLQEVAKRFNLDAERIIELTE